MTTNDAGPAPSAEPQKPTVEPVAVPPPAPLGAGGLLGFVLLFIVCSAMTAAIEVLLVPVRVGQYIVPVAVVLAVVTNVVVPRLAHAATGSVGLAGITVAVWMIVVLLLSQSRPEGDVLLPGGRTGVVYVVYATMLAGLITGLATVVLLGRRSGRARLP